MVVGWDIDKSGLNSGLFATLYIKEKSSANPIPKDLKDVFVVGKIISDDESTSVNWESVLENMNAENKYSVTSALMQSDLSGKALEALGFKSDIVSNMRGKTLINKDQSIQIFKGSAPLNFNLSLLFEAQEDAYKEVDLALQYLYKFQAPKLGNGFILGTLDKNKNIVGEIPFDIVIDYMGKRFNGDFVLTNISTSRDKIRIDKNKNNLSRVVNLSFKSKQSLDRDSYKIKIK